MPNIDRHRQRDKVYVSTVVPGDTVTCNYWFVEPSSTLMEEKCKLERLVRHGSV